MLILQGIQREILFFAARVAGGSGEKTSAEIVFCMCLTMTQQTNIWRMVSFRRTIEYNEAVLKSENSFEPPATVTQ